MPNENDRDHVPEAVQKAWDTVMGARLPVWRSHGEPLSGQEEFQLKGELLGNISARTGGGVTSIRCSDGSRWVIDYAEQSPYQAFAGRQVVASGCSCKPPDCHVIGVTGHFAVSTLRLAEMAADAWLTEVGTEQFLNGYFDKSMNNTAQFPWSFVTETGDTFLVVNNPAGATMAEMGQASCYPVRVSSCVADPQQPYLWVICPFSYGELWELRERPDSGLPLNVYVDADSGKVRYWRPPAKLDDIVTQAE